MRSQIQSSTGLPQVSDLCQIFNISADEEEYDAEESLKYFSSLYLLWTTWCSSVIRIIIVILKSKGIIQMHRVSQDNTYHILKCSNLRIWIDKIRKLKQSRAVAKSKPKLGPRFPCSWYIEAFYFLQIRTSQSFPKWQGFTLHSSNLNPSKAELSPLSITPSCVIPKRKSWAQFFLPASPSPDKTTHIQIFHRLLQISYNKVMLVGIKII